TALRRAKELPLHLGEIVGLAFHGADSPHTQLVEYLRTKEMLLLLDNFEHLLAPGPEGVSLVVEMLRKAPGVKMLVTSRERLNLYEEIVFDTPGLALPDREPENAGAFSAVALFLQTARRVQRGFSPAEDDWPEIIRTCRLLEGMPLAIELAASWTRQYPCARIAHQIGHSLDFLRTSFRNLPARHRSLRAVFDHSWELLTPPEQAVFCQLTVFEGGFTPDAVASVISYQSSVFSDDYSEDQPLTIDHRPLNTEHWPLNTEHWPLNTEHWLPSFADKSLLQPQPDGRYDVHPLLR
ncbi:MAG: hypothetical protein GY792_11980, partial [Gammaproteobacteria bacterium]|nr:hypothetical protein [Gammaproteobacteria bacterium]